MDRDEVPFVGLPLDAFREQENKCEYSFLPSKT